VVDCSVLIQWSDILYSQSSTVIASFHQPTFLIAQLPVPLLYIPLHAPSAYTCIPSYCQVGIVSVACGIILYVVIAFIARVNEIVFSHYYCTEDFPQLFLSPYVPSDPQANQFSIISNVTYCYYICLHCKLHVHCLCLFEICPIILWDENHH